MYQKNAREVELKGKERINYISRRKKKREKII